MSRPLPEQRRRREVTANDRARFLASLREGWSVKAAADATGHSRQRYYELRSDDEGFAEAFAQAVEEGTDRLEQQALEIALKGAVEEVRDGDGNLVSTRRRPDPQMVRFLLTARRPAIYSDRARVEITGRDGEPLRIEGHEPPTMDDVIQLAGELGVLSRLGYERIETIDGAATEQTLELMEGETA